MTTFNIDIAEAIQFTAEPETRTIRGLAVPFGKVAVSGGQQWTFYPGTLT